jgi:hypothetical protein
MRLPASEPCAIASPFAQATFTGQKAARTAREPVWREVFMKKKRAWFLSWEGVAKIVPTEAAAVEALLKQYGWGMGEFTLDVSMASDKHEDCLHASESLQEAFGGATGLELTAIYDPWWQVD